MDPIAAVINGIAAADDYNPENDGLLDRTPDSDEMEF